MTLKPKPMKLLALALDKAAADGEWKNAAVMFIATLRKSGTGIEALTTPSPRPASSWTPWRAPEPAPWPTSRRMPFGCHKGKRLSDVPTNYLQWLTTLPDLKPQLRRDIEAELSQRDA
jgi:hypothetical protein